jgi:hypothetical protein
MSVRYDGLFDIARLRTAGKTSGHYRRIADDNTSCAAKAIDANMETACAFG